jgi:AcrR family transcriptional regulator
VRLAPTPGRRADECDSPLRRPASSVRASACRAERRARRGATPHPSPLRRAPRQSRGQRRIALILDAAEALFAEAGYEATTTNAIAARAETAIGSLYQFFPNKEAIVRALVARFLDQMRAAFDAAVPDPAALARVPLARLIDRVVDPLVALHARRAGILRVYFTLPRTGELAGTAQAVHEAIIVRLEAIVAAREPWVAAADQRRRLEVVVEIFKALLPLTADAGGAPRPEMVAELKRAIRAYLEAALADARAGRGPE